MRKHADLKNYGGWDCDGFGCRGESNKCGPTIRLRNGRRSVRVGGARSVCHVPQTTNNNWFARFAMSRMTSTAPPFMHKMLVPKLMQEKIPQAQIVDKVWRFREESETTMFVSKTEERRRTVRDRVFTDHCHHSKGLQNHILQRVQ